MSSENPYAPPGAAVADIPVREAAPPLWNPSAAASWSLLFSPIFGSILHMKNWQAMGDEKRAETSRKWAIGSVVFFVVLLVLSVILPDAKALDALSRVAGFALLIAWYYSIGKSQNAMVLARYGKNYPRKGWAKPLGVAIGALLGFFIVAAVIGFVIGMLSSAA